jgi:predicted ATPase
MNRFIVSGAPGAGKTSVLAELARLGYQTVPEAATDVITRQQARGIPQPWQEPAFIDQIVVLQRRRQRRSGRRGGGAGVQFYDRSPVCTLALARHLGCPVSAVLAREIARITREAVYRRQVFFIRPIGFVEPTAARRISYAESLRFEREHEAAYLGLGFELVDIPAATAVARAAMIEAHTRAIAAR